MKKNILAGFCVLLLVAIGSAAYFQQEIQRVSFATSLFSGAEQYDNFYRIAELFPVTTMTAAPDPEGFAQGSKIQLPESFDYSGKPRNVQQFIEETDTAGLLVLHNRQIVFEDYYLTGGEDVVWLSMSVAKSFISAAIGIAVDEGRIDIHKPLDYYVPSLKGSAYGGARVQDVLYMASGASWNEDYSDPLSDINRLGRVIAMGGSADEFVASSEREFEPGTINRYNSTDTQALGMLLSRATGRTVTEYLTEKLWHPLGMENDAYWIIDDHNVEMAFFGLNATARDYAKLGELYRQKGKWGEQQIISEAWVTASTTPAAPPHSSGDQTSLPTGYGYQWWIPESDEGEFVAIGVYNQFIYVNTARNLVIVKLSAYSDYATSLDESAYREMESIEFFRSIAKAF